MGGRLTVIRAKRTFGRPGFARGLFKWAGRTTKAAGDGGGVHPLPRAPSEFAALSPARQHALLGGDQSIAFQCVKMLAEAGIIEAQLRLGRMLLSGAGCAADTRRALAWFRTAARDGDAQAMNMVGRCCENGWGVAPDTTEAAAWFRRAAVRGNPWGQYNLGHLLLDGNGVPENKVDAFAWYLCAAEQGHARAMNLVARCLEQGWGTPRSRFTAVAWYRKSAEGGYFRGQLNYATLLMAAGKTTEAQAWLLRAKDSATPEVVCRIEAMLMPGTRPHQAALAEDRSRF